MQGKWMTGTAVTLISALALTACGGGNSNGGASSSPPASAPASSAAASSPSPSASAPAETTEVTFAGWSSSPEEQALLQQVLDEFQAQNPEIKVKYEVIADQYMDVIKTRLIGGEAPDVFYLDAFEAPGLIGQNVLEPLDGYVTDDFDLADFETPMLDAFKGTDGKMYGFPKDTSTLALFERVLGPTRTSLAEQKARLIFCTPDPELVPKPSPWPHSYRLPEGIGAASGRTVVNHAGVFCAERLDVGTRFLLANLPPRTGAEHVVDLGCGNGVVGLAAALANPEARVTFVDESYQAVASAEATYRANLPDTWRAAFVVGDGLAGFARGSVDLVLNNPPFHSHQATTDRAAWRMFTGSRAALRPGGELWVVGNRHLGYHVKLKRIFGNAEVVAANRKFVVLRAVRR